MRRAELATILRTNSGQAAVALDELTALVETWRGIVDQDPSRTYVRRQLWRGLRDLGVHGPGTLEERLALFDEAERHVELLEDWTGWTNIVQSRSDALDAVGRTSEALEVLADALDAKIVGPDGVERPKIQRVRASALERYCVLLHKLERFDEALQGLDELTVLLEGEIEDFLVPIKQALPGRYAEIYIKLGLRDRAAPVVNAQLELARKLLAEETLASWMPYAFVRAANLALMNEDNVRAQRIAEEFLPYSASFAHDGIALAMLDHVRGLAQLWTEREHAELPKRAADLFRAGLSRGDLPAHLSLKLHTSLIFAELESGDLGSVARSCREQRVRLQALRETGETRLPMVERAGLTVVEARLAAALGFPDGDAELHCERLEVAFDELCERWAAAPVRVGGIGWLQTDYRLEVIGEALRYEVLVRGPEQALRQVLRLEALSTQARSAGLPAADLDALRAELLGPGGGAILVFFTAFQSHVFFLDETRVLHAELPRREWMRSLVERYSASLSVPLGSQEEHLADRLRGERERLGEQLAEMMFPGEELSAALEDVRRLWIVSNDLAGGVPLECLRLGDGPPLGLRMPVSHLATLTYGLHLVRRNRALDRGRERDLLLVVGSEAPPPVVERWPQVASLPVSERDRASLAAAYPDGRAEVSCEGPRDGRELLDRVGGFRVVQFLVHGVEDSARERPVGLVLGASREPLAADDPGAILWTEDLDGLRFPTGPELVILTACRSGARPVRFGDAGAARMATGWLNAGSQAVLHAPTALGLAPSLALSRTLHDRLARAGESPAEALLHARRALVEAGDYADPFYHAWIRIEGLGHTPVFALPVPEPRAEQTGPASEGRVVRALLALGAAAASIAAAALLVRRRAS